VTRGLRHEDPRCGREHFDARAGIDWEYGPDPTDTTGLIPDVPWKSYKRASEQPNKLLFENERWAVTPFGLELLASDVLEQLVEIAAGDLPRIHDHGRVYYWPIKLAEFVPWTCFIFLEKAFRTALHLHLRKRGIVIDNVMLDTTFRRARAIAQHGVRNALADRKRKDRGLLLGSSAGATVIAVQRRVNRPLDGSWEIWLQFRGGHRDDLRLPNENDKCVLSAAHASFFTHWYGGPDEVSCAAEWAGGEWLLLKAA
jgi:hypothetical protein